MFTRHEVNLELSRSAILKKFSDYIDRETLKLIKLSIWVFSLVSIGITSLIVFGFN
jgi:hypothetical protein